MANKEYKTTKVHYKGYDVVVTQESFPYGGGHYRWAIYSGEHLTNTGSTTGGVPSYDITEEKAKEIVDNFIRWTA